MSEETDNKYIKDFIQSITKEINEITLSKDVLNDVTISPDQKLFLRAKEAYKKHYKKYHRSWALIEGTVGVATPHWWFRHIDGVLVDINALDMIPCTLVIKKNDAAQDIYLGKKFIDYDYKEEEFTNG